MTYACCHLSIIPVRASASDTSEMVNQLLFGDSFEILEQKSGWLKIKSDFDQYEGWIDAKQGLIIEEKQFDFFSKNALICSTDLVEYVSAPDEHLIPIVMGSSVKMMKDLGYRTDANCHSGHLQRDKIVSTALLYLNSPYLWGGRSPFGIDCSGLTQMVYKICGIKLKRDASQQARQGENLSFIEEAQPGDLAFFDNTDGEIIHVGIIMKNNYIIHAHGKVRIDRLDHTGIFNNDIKNYTHQLRVIKHISE
jgi:hypothetical protein